MNEIRRAIYQRLSTDSTLTGLLAASDGIYHQQAPQTAQAPYIVFHKQSGVPFWQFDSAHIQNDLWLVKAVDQGSSASRAEDIAARIDVLLTDAPFSITDHTRLAIFRESDVVYPETDGADLFHHVGALFRVLTAPS